MAGTSHGGYPIGIRMAACCGDHGHVIKWKALPWYTKKAFHYFLGNGDNLKFECWDLFIYSPEKHSSLKKDFHIFKIIEFIRKGTWFCE